MFSLKDKNKWILVKNRRVWLSFLKVHEKYSVSVQGRTSHNQFQSELEYPIVFICNIITYIKVITSAILMEFYLSITLNKWKRIWMSFEPNWQCYYKKYNTWNISKEIWIEKRSHSHSIYPHLQCEMPSDAC